uniref:Retrovirus-related Pol polyprotein from transposon 17.6 n=1 Tax=Cajanus cajan TaxID=3821 RepID=A0A151R1J3_CAJCA|nr:Retrovirus-related Pol polyprotein from transposon 17.6 [Cajanus cajan]
MGGERAQVVKEETTKLLQAGFIREVKYSTWLANVVMVKKENGKMVDGAAGHQRLSFLDAYSGCNQIPMYPPDEEKTAFITDSANFCYKVMPFGLRNAGATYQRLMDKIFRRQIGKCMEVYVDDMVIKSTSANGHIRDLGTIFDEVRRHHMRLNSAKCTFGVAGGKFLGFMLSKRGIEANPDKCQAIVNMRSPQCESSFQDFKTMLTAPLLLAKPNPQLDMIIYISISDKAISTALVQEKTKQMPVYFISRVLQEAETRYQHLEKMILALEIYEGIYGTHSGGRTLAAKVIRAGYYWPTLTTNYAKFVQQCKPCQQHGPLTNQPAEDLHFITTPWPFSVWGMDILGPFLPAKGQVKFLIVVVDHFTKWIEAEAVAVISANNVHKFFWRNVITQFGVPHALITDNDLQFTDRRFNEFLDGLQIKHRMTSVEHPQSNGQAKAANKVILKELKRRLGKAIGQWPDRWVVTLWAYRCTPQSSTKETPFRLTYRMDTMIPVEIGEPSLRREQFEEETNTEALNMELDLIEETSDRALINMEACRLRVSRKHQTKIRPREFHQGDLVWRVTREARKNRGQGKLAANWDGPFRARHNLNNGAYKLEELNGKIIPRTWNVTHLKHYFS